MEPISLPRYQTKQQLVYTAIRQAIINCDLAPGQRLVIDELSRQLGASSSPVREALQQLQAEEMVEFAPLIGFRVAPISAGLVFEIFLAKEGLEDTAYRVACDRVTEGDLRALADLVRRMDDRLDAGDHDGWADLNRAFHLQIVQSAHLDFLARLLAGVMDRWDRVRRYLLKGKTGRRLLQAQAEHHELLSALEARAADRVSLIVRDHNRNAWATYARLLGVAEPRSHQFENSP